MFCSPTTRVLHRHLPAKPGCAIQIRYSQDGSPQRSSFSYRTSRMLQYNAIQCLTTTLNAVFNILRMTDHSFFHVDIDEKKSEIEKRSLQYVSIRRPKLFFIDEVLMLTQKIHLEIDRALCTQLKDKKFFSGRSIIYRWLTHTHANRFGDLAPLLAIPTFYMRNTSTTLLQQCRQRSFLRWQTAPCSIEQNHQLADLQL